MGVAEIRVVVHVIISIPSLRNLFMVCFSETPLNPRMISLMISPP